MQVKQKKMRIFEISIDSEEKFFSYMDKNLVLLKDFLLLINGDVTDKIIQYLDDNSLCYVMQDKCNLRTIDEQREKEKLKNRAKVEVLKQIIHDEKIIPTKIVFKPVRSGEVIESDGDVIAFSRINSGAKIISEGNVLTFDVIDGIVESYGQMCFIKKINKGHFIFNGDILDKDDFDGSSLKRVIKTSDGYKIEDVPCNN